MIDKEKAFVNNPTPTIQEEVLTLRIENAELKAYIEKLSEQHADEWQKQQEVITELKERLQIESKSLHEQCELVSKQVEQIEKMKNCRNCKNWNWKHSKCDKRLKGDCLRFSKWELAE